jgi:DNA invertase Pin-like site-specific DNA recombinase
LLTSARRHHRPQAAALLAALADPSRDFDAIVVGEYERAFSDDQLLQLGPHLRRHQVAMWLPETGGPVDFDDPAHQAMIMLLGSQSRREVQRSRFRVIAAMTAQTRDQGRYLGGRPPYGWIHQRPGYRCRHGHKSSTATAVDRPKILYVREDNIVSRLRTHPSLEDHTEDSNLFVRFLVQIICDDNHYSVGRQRPKNS